MTRTPPEKQEGILRHTLGWNKTLHVDPMCQDVWPVMSGKNASAVHADTHSKLQETSGNSILTLPEQCHYEQMTIQKQKMQNRESTTDDVLQCAGTKVEYTARKGQRTP